VTHTNYELGPRAIKRVQFLQVDHFSFASNATFKMRYLVNETSWNKNSGAIFFYTGNEGDITMFAENTVRNVSLIFQAKIDY
jgi:Serine carboxypeptidase S28